MTGEATGRKSWIFQMRVEFSERSQDRLSKLLFFLHKSYPFNLASLLISSLALHAPCSSSMPHSLRTTDLMCHAVALKDHTSDFTGFSPFTTNHKNFSLLLFIMQTVV